jgi:drug/metabolite transporter (DMT)-like permease
MKHSTLRADLLLLLAAILWGGAFVAQRVGMQYVQPLTFNGVRFALGAAVLVPIIAIRSLRGRAGEDHASEHSTADRGYSCLFGGIVAGLVMFAAVSLQQFGVVYTTAGKAGFITGLYVGLVPILGLLVGQRTRAATWVGAGLSVVGLYFLSVIGPLEVNRGDGLVMICAVVWAIHVVLIGKLAPRVDPLKLGLVQFATVAVISLIGAACTETITPQGLRAAAGAIAYGGLVSVGIAFTLQLVGQRHAPAAHAAILLGLEAVFSAIAAYFVLAETLDSWELFGAALMFAGMLVSQINRLWARSPSLEAMRSLTLPAARPPRGRRAAGPCPPAW